MFFARSIKKEHLARVYFAVDVVSGKGINVKNKGGVSSVMVKG